MDETTVFKKKTKCSLQQKKKLTFRILCSSARRKHFRFYRRRCLGNRHFFFVRSPLSMTSTVPYNIINIFFINFVFQVSLSWESARGADLAFCPDEWIYYTSKTKLGLSAKSAEFSFLSTGFRIELKWKNFQGLCCDSANTIFPLRTDDYLLGDIIVQMWSF